MHSFPWSVTSGQLGAWSMWRADRAGEAGCISIPTLRCLNLGCGTDIRQDCVNLDRAALPGVDVVHDLECIPYPFPDEYFDKVYAFDVLEHVDLIPVMNEIYRILKAGGVLVARVPHFTSRNNFVDPTHKKMFSILTFEFFVRSCFEGRSYYGQPLFSTLRRQHISFQKRPLFFYNYLIERLVNICHFLQYLYEATAMSRIFPAENIEVELIK